MKNRGFNLLLLFLLVLTSCSMHESGEVFPSAKKEVNPGGQSQSGVITAGEWNDLDNWSFWDVIINKEEFKSLPSYWSFFSNNRISVKIVDADSLPVVDAAVHLKREGEIIFHAKTDNQGKAELWVGLFQQTSNVDFTSLTIDVNNSQHIIENVKPYKDGINRITMSPVSTANKIEVSFVVDATGSMGDELEFLKTELLDVIARVKHDNPNSTFATSSVFYRDEGDAYVTRVSGFTNDINKTVNFIKDQNADGGGDFPEAVHTALDKAINELQWSLSAKTRLIFLLLDAPPHHNTAVIANLQSSIAKAAEKGIKIIPVTASGIDKETEFLMRFISISTNGTYVFITDHSGIGESHLEPTVGQYQVEYLNDLMVRLINKYAQ